MRISDWSSDVCSSDLEEADDAPRLDPGSLRQAGAAINRRVGEFIKSTPDLLKYPLVAQPFHGCARDTSRVEIAAACDAALTCHLKGPIAVTHCFHSSDIVSWYLCAMTKDLYRGCECDAIASA